MIDAAAAEYETLRMAGDDDAGAFYDLLWRFDEAFTPDLIEERLRAAKQAIRDLMSRGWLRLCSPPGPAPTSKRRSRLTSWTP